MIGNIKCVKGSYDDGFYDEIEDQFYCKGCAEKYNKEWRFLAKEAILCINAKIVCFVLGHVLIGCVWIKNIQILI